MYIVWMILVSMLVLTGLVAIHEFGHYLAAKKKGIRVDTFAIGFGPRLIRWRRGETEFSLRPILVGGYVAFADDPDSEAKEGDFRAASVSARALTAAAGPAMNAVFAWLLVVIMLLCAPEFQAVQIAGVNSGSPAEAAGLQSGDIVKSVNGVPMDFYLEGVNNYQLAPRGEQMPITVERDGKKIDAVIQYAPEDKERTMGVSLQPTPHNFFESLGLSFVWLGQRIGEIFEALGNLFFRGTGLQDMTGIVGTTVVVGQVMRYGTAGIMLMLIALISINLAIVNLLPIPALDGGKLCLLGIEGLRKKAVPVKVEGIINVAGMALIMGLAFFLIYQDIMRLVA